MLLPGQRVRLNRIEAKLFDGLEKGQAIKPELVGHPTIERALARMERWGLIELFPMPKVKPNARDKVGRPLP